MTLSDEQIAIIRQGAAPLPGRFYDQYFRAITNARIPIHHPRLPTAVFKRWYVIFSDALTLTGSCLQPRPWGLR
jgi:hypothetical protein